MHRIGRTGRFGNFGVAVSFVSRRSDDELLTRIERIYGRGKALIHPASRVEDVEAMVSERWPLEHRGGVRGEAQASRAAAGADKRWCWCGG